MKVFNKPCTVDLDGQRIQHDIQYILSDRAASLSTNTNIDYTEISSIGVSESKCISDIIDVLGFNPFNIVKYLTTNSTSYTYSDLIQIVTNAISNFGISYDYFPTNDGGIAFTDYKSYDNVTLLPYSLCPGYISGTANCNLNTSGGCSMSVNQYGIDMSLTALTERCYDHNILEPNYATGKTIDVVIRWNTNYGTITTLQISPAGTVNLESYFNSIAASESDDIYTVNPNNPYGGGSGTGGGDGSYGDADVDTIEKVGVPDVPDIDALTTGLITIYNPTVTALQSLGNFLWSNNFDLDTFKKLFGDPMEAIIGLGIIPVNPSLGGSKEVKIGDVDTGVSMSYLSSQFVTKSMGSLNIKKEIGCFLDYTQTKIQIYLPYVGIRDLSTDDVMGKTVSVDYNIDCLTGGCAAIVSVDGCVFYQFNGSCIANVPLTSINYSGAIQNAVTGALSLGITAVGAASGMAPLTVAGVSGLASTASNTVFNQKPSIQKSGSMGGAAGLMSVQQPYLIITRPRKAVPTDLNKFVGQTIYMTMNLSKVDGFTMVDQIILEGIPAMEEEKKELESILKKGAIF